MLPLRLRSTVRALGLSTACYLALALIRSAFRLVTLPRPPAAAALVVAQASAVAIPWILLTPPLLQLIGRLPARAGRRGVAITLATHAGLALALSLVDGLWGWLAIGWLGANRSALSLPLWCLGRLDQSLFLYLSLAGGALVLRRRRELDALALRGARLEGRLLGARLHVLALQLQPHFLFNTLNAVSELVHRDAATAAGLIRRLRTLLDRSMADDTGQEIPLREEVDLLEAYAEIQRVRFAGALTVEVTIDPALLDLVVPRLVLQPLVENAIRHGTSQRAAAGRVAVRGRRQGALLVLEVENDGRGLIPGPVREGVGLGNTRARLHELYGADARLELGTAPRGPTLARIELPLRSGPIADGDDVESTDQEAANSDATAPPLRWLRLAGAVVAGWIAAALIGTHEDVVAGWLTGDPEPLLILLRPRLGEALLWIPLTGLALAFAARLARGGITGLQLAGAHLAGGLAVLAAHLLAVRLWVTPDMDGTYAAGTLLYDLCAYAALASAAHAWTLGRMVADRALDAARLERDLTGARLESLRWRLSPAFLGGALEAIAALAGTDPDRADELTGALGELLRLLLAGAGQEEVALEREVDFLRLQLQLLSLARGTAPVLHQDMDADCTCATVPAMLLQPLAEMPGVPAIELAARRSAGWLVLTLRWSGRVEPGRLDVLAAQLATRLRRAPGATVVARPGGRGTIELRLRWVGAEIPEAPEPALAGVA